MYSGLVGSTNYGNHNVGFEETCVTHPYAQTFETTTNADPIVNLTGSKFEFDCYPRALISKMWTYNQEFSLAPTGTGSSQMFTSN